jgi:hypothetical protein
VPFLMIWSVLGRNVPARGRVEVQYVDPAWESSVPAEGIDRFAPPDWSAGARFFERGAADANGSLLEKRWRRHPLSPRLSTLDPPPRSLPCSGGGQVHPLFFSSAVPFAGILPLPELPAVCRLRRCVRFHHFFLFLAFSLLSTTAPHCTAPPSCRRCRLTTHHPPTNHH